MTAHLIVVAVFLQAWVQIMANYTKTNDANHLVTIGYEGFWGEYDSKVEYNPGNGWAGITGQNFSVNMAHAEIDFAEIHYWPDEWFANPEDITYDAARFLSTWFNEHAIVATALGKPLLLEEFGKAVNVSAFLLLCYCICCSLLLQLWNVTLVDGWQAYNLHLSADVCFALALALAPPLCPFLSLLFHAL